MENDAREGQSPSSRFSSILKGSRFRRQATHHRVTLKDRSPEEVLGDAARKEGSNHLRSTRMTGDGDLLWISTEAGESRLKELESIDDIPDGKVGLQAKVGGRKKTENTGKG